MLIDTHCHLFYEELKNDLSNVLKRAQDLDVTKFICVATNMEDARECLLLGETHDNIFASAGIHPHDAKDAPEDFVDQIYDLMTFDSMIAVGEMGLDYFRNISDSEIQKNVFRSQMEIAQDLSKPIIFHNRDADVDTINILKEFPDVQGVAHCFSSDLETAKAFMELGYYISFSGNLTFKNSHLPDVAKELPLDKILVETDSPYLSPVPFRGKPNEPGRTRYVAEKLAKIYNVPLELIAEKTTQNAVQLFGLPHNK
ncbi:MAG: TatD family hydrolase [Candidatus Marinimicrobia bacterium]|jgi:TatD DNase family protein|nr:TatD family hydrolase [Candidatus Neomarinimicrobiota bacterium]MBT3840030.1 TatD family hydrolase [Candidatus Neomarinimicrobiota bacterium]MBT4000062.1 TatD family hydrolase [Candidatus Neomarinimicrobiota bacterium]MBT4282139.1 TatD family hydrolase [Candidatus Neomarinimicrobiota bacterium]MBT4578878.1 TatD family hydrolase [Candidatus Neomarinimicrobiota bacterium]